MELEVDSIGGMEKLTEEEARALSEFFSKRKEASKKKNLKKGQKSSVRVKKTA